MKPFYVVLLMGAAALGGGFVVRYSERPADITVGRSVPPTVVAPPIPPRVHIGPSSSVPVRSAPSATPPAPAADLPEMPAPLAVKPSALSERVHVSKLERSAPEPRPVGRVRIPPEPPAVTPLEHYIAPPPTPTPAPPAVAAKPAPAPPAAPVPPTAVAEGNHATLKAGMLISVRIREALSSNLNSKGDVFSGTLDKPLVADGFVIAERGARVRGEVVESRSSGRESELSVRLREILASDGQRVHLVSEPWRKQGADDAARGVYDAALTRGGAAVIRPATSITFRLDQNVELTERH